MFGFGCLAPECCECCLLFLDLALQGALERLLGLQPVRQTATSSQVVVSAMCSRQCHIETLTFLTDSFYCAVKWMQHASQRMVGVA